MIAITTRFLSKNPGVYISRDRGLTWNKSNTNIVIPQHIEALKFDIHDASQLWIGTLGTGFYKGKIKEGEKVQVVDVEQDFVNYKEGVDTQLSASIINADYTGETIIWKSATPEVATVDEKGLVTPLKCGTTKIWATTSDGRFSDYALFVVQSMDVSVSDELKDNISIVPVPVKDTFTIKGITGEYSVKVYSLNGSLILKKQGTTGEINLSGFNSGAYLVEITTNQYSIVKKIIKA